MTDDLKAPERIWAWHHKDATLDARLWEAASPAPSYFPGKEYVDADRIADLEAALADMTRQRDAAMAGALSVRELAWEQLGERAWRAPSPLFGSFRVERYGDRLWQALWSVPGICDTFVEGDFATADDAKQAIQARILSALTPDPDRMLALTAAAYEDAVSGLERDIEDREIDAARFRAGTNPHHYRMNLAQAIRYHAAQIRARIPADAISALSRIEAQAEARGWNKAMLTAITHVAEIRNAHTPGPIFKALNEAMGKIDDARFAGLLRYQTDATEAAASEKDAPHD